MKIMMHYRFRIKCGMTCHTLSSLVIPAKAGRRRGEGGEKAGRRRGEGRYPINADFSMEIGMSQQTL
jgi:hypothetical protein